MKNRKYIAMLTGIAAFCFQTGTAAVVDVTEGRHWAQLCEDGVTLRWNKSWVSDNAVTAQLSITGMSVRVSESLDPDDEAYVWNVQLGDKEEDVCAIKLSFNDEQGHSLGTLETQLAVSKSAFKTANVRANDDETWQIVKDDVLIPWNAAWLNSTNACEQINLEWANAQSGAVSSSSSFGFHPFVISGRPKGQYDLTLSLLDGNDGMIGSPFLATLFLQSSGTLFILN